MKNNPDRVRELTHAPEVLRLINGMAVQLLPIDVASLDEAQEMVREFGLLASDAMIVGLMRHHQITHLATNDDDFDRIPGITVWKPR